LIYLVLAYTDDIITFKDLGFELKYYQISMLPKNCSNIVEPIQPTKTTTKTAYGIVKKIREQ